MEQNLLHATTIEQLYDDYQQPILRYLNRLVSDRETAEDLCHETFIKALRHWNELKHAAVARSWLYRIATNTAYDYLRRRRCVAITPLADEHAATAGAPALEKQFDDAEAVWIALNHLPEHYRVPLLLQVGAGYTLHDIAAALGCNVNTIKTRVHQARALPAGVCCVMACAERELSHVILQDGQAGCRPCFIDTVHGVVATFRVPVKKGSTMHATFWHVILVQERSARCC